MWDLLTEYTLMGGFKDLTLSVFKRDITPNLGKFIPTWIELIEGHLPNSLPNSQEWTPVNVYPKVLRQLGILTARVMVDADTPHNENWQFLSTEYLDSGMSYAHDLKQWPALMRPFVYRFMPQYTEVQRQFKNGRRVIVNAINMFDERESNETAEPEPKTVLYHLSRKVKGTSASVVEMHLKEQMNLASGAIHTTSAVLTQTIFELAARPSYIPELRKEIMEIQTKFGQLKKAALWEMHKMDSFVREVHRLHSPNLS
ncbi:hypothetical protein SLS63_006160 [Diaporthe eres]|uniref:Uncharacterized protein n=1 Tax=Diaporthe eres TaxID=83184 RepID=A0ABR1P8N4_DIAER